MNLLSENAIDLPKGIMGIGLEFGPFSTKVKPPRKFLELSKQFDTSCKGERAFSFHLISKKRFPLGLHVYFHGHPKADSIDEFTLIFQRKPSGKTPISVKSQSDRIGGFPTGFNQVMDALGAPTVKCSVEMKGLVLAPLFWPLRFGVTHKQKDIPSLKMESQKLCFRHSGGGEIELDFSKKGELDAFRVTAELSITLDSSCADQACDQLWAVLKGIFKNDGTPEIQSKASKPNKR